MVFFVMIKILELAINKVAALPEAAQEQLGREILERVDLLSELRTEVEAGIAELNSGLGAPLDVEEVIAEAHLNHAGRG